MYEEWKYRQIRYKKNIQTDDDDDDCNDDNVWRQQFSTMNEFLLTSVCYSFAIRQKNINGFPVYIFRFIVFMFIVDVAVEAFFLLFVSLLDLQFIVTCFIWQSHPSRGILHIMFASQPANQPIEPIELLLRTRCILYYLCKFNTI